MASGEVACEVGVGGGVREGAEESTGQFEDDAVGQAADLFDVSSEGGEVEGGPGEAGGEVRRDGGIERDEAAPMFHVKRGCLFERALVVPDAVAPLPCLDGFESGDGRMPTPRLDEATGDVGLADFRPRARDHDEPCGHRSASRSAAATAAMAGSSWLAVTVSRRRAVPAGTVGGRIAGIRNPCSCNRREVSTALAAVPTITGMM
jgi:hypothetical protein